MTAALVILALGWILIQGASAAEAQDYAEQSEVAVPAPEATVVAEPELAPEAAAPEPEPEAAAPEATAAPEPELTADASPEADLTADASPEAGVFAEADTHPSVPWNLGPAPGVNAAEAWAQGATGQGVIVAVLDTGIDISHPALVSHIWTNSAEIAGNGIDDDGNGYIDDTNGWDFAHDDSTVFDPADGEAHGTHVAGVIAQVAPDATILALKVLGPTGGYSSDAAEAIYYAVAAGAQVVNASWSSQAYSPALADAIAYASTRGVLFVTSAGQGGYDLDEIELPHKQGSPNMVVIASVGPGGHLSEFSNHSGPVTAAAPGENVMSTISGSGQGSMSGTSVATAHASGAAALTAAAYHGISGSLLASHLTATAARVSTLAGIVTSDGTIDAAAAVTTIAAIGAIERPAPTPPTLTSHGDDAAVLAPDSAGGTLYGIEGYGSKRLFTVDTATGVGTAVGTGTGMTNPGGLAYNSTTGILYGIEFGGSKRLFTVNTATGVGTAIGTGTGMAYSDGLAYDSTNSILYGIEWYGSARLFTVDTATGDGTAVGTGTGMTEPGGLEFVPPTTLTITKTDSPDPVLAGQTLTYTITVANTGANAATGTSVTDTFPAELTGVAWTCAASGSAVCGAGSGSGNLTDSPTLPAGGSVTYTVSGTVASGTPSGTIANTATVTWTNPSGSAASATQSTTITAGGGGGQTAAAGVATLPFTGAESMIWKVIVGIILVVSGAGLLVAGHSGRNEHSGRRRRRLIATR